MEVETLKYYLTSLKEGFQTKLVVGIIFANLAGLFEFLYGVQHVKVLLALFVMMVIDLIFALYVVKVTGLEIKSKSLGRGARKFVIYFTLVLAGRMFDYTLFQQIMFAEDTIIGYLAAQEMVSLLEHAAALGYGVPMQFLNRLKVYTKNQ